MYGFSWSIIDINVWVTIKQSSMETELHLRRTETPLCKFHLYSLARICKGIWNKMKGNVNWKLNLLRPMLSGLKFLAFVRVCKQTGESSLLNVIRVQANSVTSMAQMTSAFLQTELLNVHNPSNAQYFRLS